MKIMIHSPFDTGDYLRDLIDEKVRKLNHFFHPIERVDVYLKNELKDKDAGKIVEMRVHIPGREVFAVEGAPKFEVAVQATFNKMKAQLQKQKSRWEEVRG